MKVLEISTRMAMPLNNNNSKKESSQFLSNTNLTELSDFPKSYITFRGKNKMDEIFNEDKLSEERESSIEKYNWAKNLDEKSVRANYDKKNAEIEIRERNAFSYLKKSTKQAIKVKFDSKFNAEKDKVSEILSNKDYYEKLIKAAQIYKADETRKKFKTNPNSLDNVVAGYKKEKDYLRNHFADAIADERNGMDVTIPNSILLYGPTGCGKTAMAEALANETGCEVMTIPTETAPAEFASAITCELEEARERYLTTTPRQRTVIVVNEIDKYTNLTGDSINKKNITALKGILDHCGEKPSTESKTGKATTFIFTTNYPGDVDTEISLRAEKCEPPLYIEHPENENMEDVFRFYIATAAETVKNEIESGGVIDLENEIKELNAKDNDSEIEAKLNFIPMYL